MPLAVAVLAHFKRLVVDHVVLHLHELVLRRHVRLIVGVL